MRKVLFLMFLLLLMGLGAASVKAQVRIGGNASPNAAAVLDLNATDATTGTKGLALPRVTLSSNTATLDGTTANINGMLVYNTSGSLSTGVYYWNGSQWVTTGGNAVMDATTNRGLVKAGSGTSTNPYTLGIAPRGVDTSMITLPDDSAIMISHQGRWRYLQFQHIISTTGTYAGTSLPLASYGCYMPPLIYARPYGMTLASAYYTPSGNSIVVVDFPGQSGGTCKIEAYCWVLMP